MADDKKQSPHYIPELDPASKKRKSAWLENMFLWLEYARYIVFGVSVVTAVVAWVQGWEQIMIVALIAAFVGGLSLILSQF